MNKERLKEFLKYKLKVKFLAFAVVFVGNSYLRTLSYVFKKDMDEYIEAKNAIGVSNNKARQELMEIESEYIARNFNEMEDFGGVFLSDEEEKTKEREPVNFQIVEENPVVEVEKKDEHNSQSL